MRHLLVCVFTVFSFFSLASCDKISDSARHFALSSAAEEVNKSVPIMVDDYTELYKVVAVNGVLQYHYMLVKYRLDQLDPDFFKRNMKDKLLISTCDNEKLKPLLSLGASIAYYYVDKEGVAIADFLVIPDDCVATS
jgi:hypothetical protein